MRLDHTCLSGLKISLPLLLKKVVRKELRKPGIEPGAQRWQRWILPLNHLRLGLLFLP